MLQIGSSDQVLHGFVNVDIRPVGTGTRRGHAADLSFCAASSVSVLFSNAVFEHLFMGQQVQAVREWRRVLSDDGVVVCLGIPNFPEIARCFLEGVPGLLGDRFDLYHVYRYTHGDPEGVTKADWSSVSPARRRNSAPEEWLPQLHKCLFDPATVAALFRAGGFEPIVFEYAFPGEPYRLCLGVVTRDLEGSLASIPGVERWVDQATVRLVDGAGPTAMAERAVALADAKTPPPGRASATIRRALRWTRSGISVRR